MSDGLLVPRLPRKSPEYRTRHYEIVCTNWFPVAAPGADTRAGETAETANWWSRSFFTDANNRLTPLRNGWQDPYSEKGFGWIHINARHPGQYNEKRVREVVEACRPQPDPGTENLRCEEDGYVIIISDEYAEDGEIKGILTVFNR